MKTYTPEQHAVLDWIIDDNDGILLVHAGAGTGKSFMAKEVVDTLRPETCLYTAFNKAIVEAGVGRFHGFNVECKTLHALAYKYVKPKGEISALSYKCIKEDISYPKKRAILDAIDRFYVSSSTDMYDFYEDFFDQEGQEPLVELALKYTQAMIDGEVNPTFNFLLKYFHLMLHEKSVVCSYDLVILDEINDTTAVSLEIFKLIQAPKKLGLGESHQAIYDFLNLVDGFELLSGQATVLNLTQSFRVGTNIANKLQKFMRRDVTDQFTFIGTDDPVANGKSLYVTYTNASIIREIHHRVASNKGFHLLRKLSEIFAYPMAVVTAGSGKKVYQRQYRHLEDEFQEYRINSRYGQSWYEYLLETIDDQETKTAVNLLLSLRRKNVNIFDLYAQAKEAEDDHSYTIATVYTAKGLEFEHVYIADCLNAAIQRVRENGGIQDHKDLVAYRCYYVAVSRCGKRLENAAVL